MRKLHLTMIPVILRNPFHAYSRKILYMHRFNASLFTKQ
uniref:Uncharacterized protein n=1 Tax=Gracilaria firma TaxID=2510791 RepID=A0A1P8D663_9FLOR|nr:hypothetical protein [Gracilaria firma]APR74288.1 hypothetical protein [Gracilaria firma]